MSSIFYHTQSSFAEHIFSVLGKGRLHAKLLYSHFMKRGSLEGFSVENQASALVRTIKDITDFELPPFKVVHLEEKTTKFLVTIGQVLEVEVVHIPMRTKTTLCISSQVGCKMGCAFCETGRMGLLKQLSSADIVSQVFIAQHRLGLPIDNIVFMGMGEPFDNFDAVVRAIEVLTQDAGLGFGPSKISVSTSGLVDKIDRFSQVVSPAVNLAVSINAPNDTIRSKIMPVNHTWNMAALKGAMERFCKHPRRQIFVEYVLLSGVNDSLECADQLAFYLKGLKVKVNLIPYNPQSRDRFAAPEEGVITAFKKRMQGHGYLCLVRDEKGQKMRAACGQLGNLELRKKARFINSKKPTPSLSIM